MKSLEFSYAEQLTATALFMRLPLKLDAFSLKYCAGILTLLFIPVKLWLFTFYK